MLELSLGTLQPVSHISSISCKTQKPNQKPQDLLSFLHTSGTIIQVSTEIINRSE